MSAAVGSPFEVTGAAHWPARAGTPARTLLRIEGFEGSVRYRAGRLAAHLAEFGAVEADHDRAANLCLWEAVRDVHALARDAVEGDLWRLSVKASDAPGLVARSGALAVQYDWGGGLVWLRVREGCDLRSRLGPFAGHATRLQGEGGGPAFQPETPAVARIAAGLRARFDPRGILNRGLMA